MHQFVEWQTEATFQGKVHQDEARMRIDLVRAGLVLLVGMPSVECRNELLQRKSLPSPRRMIPGKNKPGRIRCQLLKRDPADVAALLQLNHVVRNRVVKFQFALFIGQRQE